MIRKTWLIAAGTLFLAAALPSPAEAGIEPVPWRLLVSNRSDAVAPDSPFHLQPMTGMVVYLVVQDPRTGTGGGGTRVIERPLAGFAILPGTSFLVEFGSETLAGGSLVGWGFTTKMGVEPTPWRGYAMEGPAEEPASWPVLPAPLLSPEQGVYAFASPGTLVGSATMVSDPFFTGCPPAAAWKNHGQYVRCVALLAGDLAVTGDVTEEEADAIVSAAAQSAVGK
jgi:hypothetical protein